MVSDFLQQAHKVFDEKKKCIIDQYSKFHVQEIEEEYQNGSVFLRSNETIREDFADMGAVKLSYEAFKLWERDNPNQKLPIGLNDFSFDQIFWISHAQTFCSFERASTTKYHLEQGKYSSYRYRLLGPLGNSVEFAKSFKCDEKSNMVRKDDEKCLLW